MLTVLTPVSVLSLSSDTVHEFVLRPEHIGRPNLTISPTGNLIVEVDFNNRVREFSLESGQWTDVFTADDCIECEGLSATDRLMFFKKENVTMVYDRHSREFASIRISGGRVVPSNTGDDFISVYCDGITVYDGETLSPTVRLFFKEKNVTSARYSSETNTVVLTRSHMNSHEIVAVNTLTQAELWKRHMNHPWVFTYYSPDSESVLFYRNNRNTMTLTVFNARTGKFIAENDFPSKYHMSPAFSSETVFTVTDNGIVAWDFRKKSVRTMAVGYDVDQIGIRRETVLLM